MITKCFINEFMSKDTCTIEYTLPVEFLSRKRIYDCINNIVGIDGAIVTKYLHYIADVHMTFNTLLQNINRFKVYN